MNENKVLTLIINNVESVEVFNKMKEMNLIREDELYIVDDNLSNDDVPITAATVQALINNAIGAAIRGGY